jgi:hypothetical protein
MYSLGHSTYFAGGLIVGIYKSLTDT